MTDSRGCEHEGTKVETASNRLNGVADPEGATMQKTHVKQEIINTEHNLKKAKISTPAAKKSGFSGTTLDTSTKKISSSDQSSCSSTSSSSFKSPDSVLTGHPDHITEFSSLSTEENLFDIDYDLD